jgi:heptosyltransferase II
LAAVVGADPQPVAPAICIPSQEVRAAAEKFGLTGGLPGARPLLGLNPGAEYGPAKRWPVEHFVQTAVSLSRRLGCVWLIVGGTADAPLAMRIQAGIEESGGAAVNVAGRTSLRELCALLRLCGAVLTNDTGPMHIAAALGTPVVVPFGSTAPELTGPGLPGDTRNKVLLGQAPCAPCFLRQCPIDLRCLKQISPEQAASALMSTLSPLKS